MSQTCQRFINHENLFFSMARAFIAESPDRGLFFGLCFMTSTSANAGPLPERVEKAALERIAAGTYQTLVFGVVNGDKSEVVVFASWSSIQAATGCSRATVAKIAKRAA
jgi:hypothetical protein